MLRSDDFELPIADRPFRQGGARSRIAYRMIHLERVAAAKRIKRESFYGSITRQRQTDERQRGRNKPTACSRRESARRWQRNRWKHQGPAGERRLRWRWWSPFHSRRPKSRHPHWSAQRQPACAEESEPRATDREMKRRVAG